VNECKQNQKEKQLVEEVKEEVMED